MKVFPVYYNDKDYYITKNGRIFDFNSGKEITNTFNKSDIAKMIAVCWIGNMNAPVKYLNGKSNSVNRRNISYDIVEKERITASHLKINGEDFYKIPGYKYYFVSKGAIFYSDFYNKFLHKKISKYPYYTKISLVNEDGIRNTLAVHRIVFMMFASEIPDKEFEVNHIDGRQWNNESYNLEATSTLENVRHSIFITKNRDHLWNPMEIHQICKLLQSNGVILDIYESNPWISNKISYSGFKILCHMLIHHTKYWVDISSQYDFSKWSAANKLYSDDQVHEICKRLEEHQTPKKISDELNIPLKYISSIKQRSARTNISKHYHF